MAMRFVLGRVDRIKALLVTAAMAATMIGTASTPAEARRHHHGYHRSSHHHVHHARAGRHRHRAIVASQASGGYLRPTYSSIIVDANTGRTLSAVNESAPHHPASVTKVMTLYLLFEQLEKGKLRLDSDLTISQHAAAQQPTKLGLRPGATIEVEDAIKAVVTRSANDIAVAIGENIAGDEDTFADMMTRRARSLGMNGTTFRNASGLPNPRQITTARDLAILGRAVQDRFPKYYKYFATRTFYFRGRPIPNHNHLLGAVEGVDGIKTGYTAASGFNLLTSVRRDGRHIVGVVLGGKSYRQRDRIMAGLIEDNLGDASTRRTAVAIAERDDDMGREMARQSARVMESAPDEIETPRRSRDLRLDARAEAPVAPPAPVAEPRRINTASLDLSVPLPPGKIEKARPAVVTAIRAEPETAETTGRAARRAAMEGTTTRPMAYAATSTPSSLRWTEGPQGRINPRNTESRQDPKPAETKAARVEKTDAKAAEGKSTESKSAASASKVPLVRPGNAGWMIQIGATDDADKAHDLLARARAKAGLATAKPFTEKVQKGSETLWRARFAGLEENSAEAACRTLKRSGFSCFATKN